MLHIKQQYSVRKVESIQFCRNSIFSTTLNLHTSMFEILYGLFG